ncbi:MAG: pentapeptide repeat-containing protein [Pseudomonadota bacterium]
MIDDESEKAIENIIESDDWSFNVLVQLSKLDPKKDFRFLDLSDLDLRGADLRGFDFTGADLRGCIIDETTLIDETTIVQDAKIDWIEGKKIPIVEKMLQISSTPNNSSLHKLLTDLSANYNSPRHIASFLWRLIRNTDSPEKVVILSNYLPSSYADEDSFDVLGELERAINKKIPSRRSRKTLNRSPTMAITPVIEEMAESSNKDVMSIYLKYAETKEDLVARKESINDFEILWDILMERHPTFLN